MNNKTPVIKRLVFFCPGSRRLGARVISRLGYEAKNASAPIRLMPVAPKQALTLFYVNAALLGNAIPSRMGLSIIFHLPPKVPLGGTEMCRLSVSSSICGTFWKYTCKSRTQNDLWTGRFCAFSLNIAYSSCNDEGVDGFDQ